MNSFTRTTQALGRGLFRAALALFGLALLLAALLAGAMLALGLTIRALLLGRRPPPVRFAWRGVPSPGWRSRGRRGPAGAAGADDVVDIEAREVRPDQR